MPDFFSKQKEKWLNGRKSLRGFFKGKKLRSSLLPFLYYRDALNKELDKYFSKLKRDLKSVYTTVGKGATSKVGETLNAYKKGENYNKLIDNSDKIVKKWLRKATRESERTLRQDLGETAGKALAIEYDKKYTDSLKLIVQRNTQLIRNTTSQTLTNIENIVFDAMTTGQGWFDIEKNLETQTDISKNRVKRIARDQTAKTNQALNELTQRAAGVKFFSWETAKDERVSTGYGGHKQLQGKIYKWGDTENYPIIDSYGHRGLPSQRVNCRCDSRPVFILKGYHAEQLEDGSYKVVKD